jgi:hypothetical protein
MNLRLREDTANYLKNLRTDRTDYDPKSRAAVFGDKEDNFVKVSDDYK